MEIKVNINLIMFNKTEEQQQKLASLLNELSQKYVMGFAKLLTNRVDDMSDSIFNVWISTEKSDDVLQLISQVDHPAIQPSIVIKNVEYIY